MFRTVQSLSPSNHYTSNQVRASDRNYPGTNFSISGTFATEIYSNFSTGVRNTLIVNPSTNQRSYFILVLGPKIVFNNLSDWLIYLQNMHREYWKQNTCRKLWVFLLKIWSISEKMKHLCVLPPVHSVRLTALYNILDWKMPS